MALLSIRCGRAGDEPSVVIEGRAAWVRYLALGLLKAAQSGSARVRWPYMRPKKFRGLSYRLTEANGHARAVVLGSLRRAKRREHVFQWLWRTIEGVLQQELTERAANYLRTYMGEGDAVCLGAAVAKRARRGAAANGIDVEVAYVRALGAALAQFRATQRGQEAERLERAEFERSRGLPRPAMMAALAMLAAGYRASP